MSSFRATPQRALLDFTLEVLALHEVGYLVIVVVGAVLLVSAFLLLHVLVGFC